MSIEMEKKPGAHRAESDDRSSVLPISSRSEFRALGVLVVVLGLLATATLRSLIAPIIIGAWFAGLTSPLIHRLSNKLGNRRHLAAVATVLLVLVIVVPIVLLAVPLSLMIANFVQTIMRSPPEGVVRQLIESASGGQALPQAAGQGGTPRSLSGLVSMVREVAPSVAGLVSRAFSTLSGAVIQVFMLAVSSYYFSAQSHAIVTAMRNGLPLARPHFDRLSRVFLDVARAMLMGELLTAAAQGAVAGVIYAVLRVPNAGFFAVLTGFVALIPTVGSALVWVPLCAILAAAGRVRDAVILGALGLVVIGSIDNILRPYFSRLGANRLHPLLLFLGIFGGIEAFGGWGIILGPLVLQMFIASFGILGDERATRRAATQTVTSPGVISTAESPQVVPVVLATPEREP